MIISRVGIMFKSNLHKTKVGDKIRYEFMNVAQGYRSSVFAYCMKKQAITLRMEALVRI